jgi:hypothetical protein
MRPRPNNAQRPTPNNNNNNNNNAQCAMRHAPSQLFNQHQQPATSNQQPATSNSNQQPAGAAASCCVVLGVCGLFLVLCSYSVY